MAASLASSASHVGEEGRENGHKRRRLHEKNCLPCRRRKSKCDREEPCSSCVLRQTEAYCYTDQVPPAASSSRSPAPNSNKRSLDPQQTSSKTKRLLETSTSVASATQTALSALDEISSSVELVKRIVLEAKLTGNDSAGSTEATMSDESKIGWSELFDFLPPVDEIEVVIHCFFQELSWITGCVHEDRFRNMWRDAVNRKNAIPRHRAALLCTMVGFVDIMSPRSHSAAQLIRKPSLDHRVQRDNARLLLESFYQPRTDEDEQESQGDPMQITVEMLLQLEAETLYCAYLCCAGLMRRAWHSTGKAIRLAKSLGVYEDAGGGHVDDGDNWQQYLKRVIGWELIVLDRWISVGYQRTFSLGLDCNIPEPTSQMNSVVHYRNTMTNPVARIIEFKQNCPKMTMTEKVSYADDIAAEYARWKNSLPTELQYEVVCFDIKTNEPESFRQAGQAVAYYASYQYALCSLFQAFLMDPNAPLHLQFAALDHAKKIIECMHVVVTVCNCPWVAIPPAWNALHLFAAATTFANVFLSAGSPAAAKCRAAWPANDIDWFASMLYEIVNTLHLIAQGTQHQTATVCKNLLVAMCESKEELKQRFQARKEDVQRTNTPGIFAQNGRDMTKGDDVAFNPSLMQPPSLTSATSTSSPSIQLAPYGEKGVPTDLMFDNIPLFDPWEWARLTANL